jgi:hypothetical protein
MYIMAKEFKRPSVVRLRKYVLRSLRDEKLRSTVAVDMGKMLAIVKRE